jgi:hypothetical protein
MRVPDVLVSVPAAVLPEAFISKTLVNNLTYVADVITESIFRSLRLAAQFVDAAIVVYIAPAVYSMRRLLLFPQKFFCLITVGAVTTSWLRANHATPVSKNFYILERTTHLGVNYS